MIADSGLALLLTSSDLAGRLWPQGGEPVQLLRLDEAAETIRTLPDNDLRSVPAPSHPAYLVYTSGSTGQPNGVIVAHAALSNLLGSMLRQPGLSASDRLAAVTTVSFDIAALELYLPLLAGACVVLVPREIASNGTALVALLAREDITVMQATPATWKLLIEAGWQCEPGFRALCGGEELSAGLARALLERSVVLWNLYGPTETTIWSTAGQVTHGTAQITVGRPLANTQIYVVDAAGHPLPVGVSGEIWIGGAGVAQYHNRPALDAARFEFALFGTDRSQRLYRTGDLGRWSVDGTLVHMGRLDNQVKLRGFRIEPGEIEAVLVEHADIKQAVVVARQTGADTKSLVAYVCYERGRELTASAARAHLRGRLPDYMIPSVFVALDRIPLTPNGKIDRRALPDPYRNAGSTGRSFVPAAPGLEQTIAQIWSKMLRVDRIGADDNFFELGGDSLLTMRVAAKIATATGYRIAPRIMFTHTLRQIAESISAEKVLMQKR